MAPTVVGNVGKAFALALWLGAGVARPAIAQGGGGSGEVLTNESITQMVVGKVPKDLILSKIHTTKNAFDLTPSGLIGLHTSRVSDDLLKAMLQESPSTVAKETLDNDAIIKMVVGQLSKSIMLIKIQNDKADYDLTTAGIIKLNQNKVSQDVIKAMMAASSATPARKP